MKLTYVHNIQPTSPILADKRAEYSAVQKNGQASVPNFGVNNSNSKCVSFCGTITKTSPYLKSTYEEVREFYQNYQKSLGETSFKDIVEITKNIVHDTGHLKKEVLTAMQKLTQFANMRSVDLIASRLKKHGVSYIGNGDLVLEVHNKISNAYAPVEIHDVVHDGVGLHRTLTYLLEHKGQGVLPKHGSIKTAYILDEQKVTQLEKLKDKYPQKFASFKNNPEIKFYTLSGWDYGISFVDRTKDLETETRRIIDYSDKTGIPIDKAIDEPLMKRIKSLGITPTIISRDGMPTELCVYNQMKPEQMTMGELYNLIDANSQVRTDDYVKLLKTKNDSVVYLKNQLKVYTPETTSKLIKYLHGIVLNKAEHCGYKPEDILYLEPEPVKSNALITYMYKKINNIPSERFANVREVLNKRISVKDKLVVFVDDCTITGDSLKGAISTSKSVFDKKHDKLFVCLCGTEDAVNTFPYYDNNRLIVGEYINYVPTRRRHLVSQRMDKALGGPDYIRGEATCLIFPYMSPDNNTEFASNIALLHNANYRLSNPTIKRLIRDPHKSVKDSSAYIEMHTLRHEGVKNFTPIVDRVARYSNKLAGTTPTTISEDFKTVKKQHPRKWTDYFKFSTYDEIFEDLFFPNPQ